MLKNLFISSSFLLLSLLFVNATIKAPAPTTNAHIQTNPQSLTKVAIEKQLGRKLNFKERVAWFIAKKEMKKLYSNGEPKETNENAILGLIFAFVLPPLGIIFSLIALSQINKNPEKYKGKELATAGLILSIAYIILTVILLVALVNAISTGCSACYVFH